MAKILIKNNLRLNRYARFELKSGTVSYDLYAFQSEWKANGISEVDEPSPPDDYSEETHYRTEQDAAPYVVYTRKSDEQIAEAHQARVNAESLAYLTSTDWMVTRYAETGVPIPDEVKAARQAARDAVVK